MRITCYEYLAKPAGMFPTLAPANNVEDLLHVSKAFFSDAN